jgi:hypothetical protein
MAFLLNSWREHEGRLLTFLPLAAWNSSFQNYWSPLLASGLPLWQSHKNRVCERCWLIWSWGPGVPNVQFLDNIPTNLGFLFVLASPSSSSPWASLDFCGEAFWKISYLFHADNTTSLTLSVNWQGLQVLVYQGKPAYHQSVAYD